MAHLLAPILGGDFLVGMACGVIVGGTLELWLRGRARTLVVAARRRGRRR